MRVLVLAEHDNREVKPSTFATITAATRLNDTVDVLIAGHGCTNISEDIAHTKGVANVRVCDAEMFKNPVAENIANLLMSIADDYDALLAPANAYGKNIMPRVAALLDTQQISDVVEIIDAQTFVRPIYAGNALATVQSSDAKKVITIRPTAFNDAEKHGERANLSTVDAVPANDLCQFVECQVMESVRPELTSANVIVAGGRGIGSDQAFELVSRLADTLGGAVGASRAAVDAGFIPNDAQVGQTGKIVAPDLYIAVGISGAIQHLAGMKDSRIIVAINKDEEAPIFQIADYGLVADVFEAVPSLIKTLEA